jgi:Fe2+ transport system protein FeoA
MHNLLPLEFVPSGQWAEVENISGESIWINRMAELGLRTGSRLRVVRQGCPCLLQVEGSRLSIRNESTTQILVRPLAPG